MGVTGYFGFQNVIPTSGNFSIVINCKVPVTGVLYRFLLLNKQLSANSTTDFVTFQSDGYALYVHLKNSAVDTVLTIDTPNRLNYVVLDFDGTNVRLWNIDDLSYQSVAFNLRFTTNNYLWLSKGPNVQGEGSSISPAIFYCAIYSGLLDTELVNLIRNGVQPLDIGHRITDLQFLREYPKASIANYITSIGSGNIVGSGNIISNTAVTNNYGTNTVNYGQDRAIVLALSNTVTFTTLFTQVINDTIYISSSFSIGETIGTPRENQIDIGHDITISSGLVLGDIYVGFSHDLTFEITVEKGSEREVSISDNILMDLSMKAWDGKISNSVSFSEILFSNITLRYINSDVIVDQNIRHNWKLQRIDDLVTMDSFLLLDSDHKINEDDVGTDRLEFVETLVCQKDFTRPLTTHVKVKQKIFCYKISADRKQNYGT